ncbi:MAG: PQQ-binding-like beta-propeller repeat protein [Thermoplasmata archaeon]|nr:MAG: PQQ-binding-like beta-propeller repeat protein [Thermoplasmata archaeon]
MIFFGSFKEVIPKRIRVITGIIIIFLMINLNFSIIASTQTNSIDNEINTVEFRSNQFLSTRSSINTGADQWLSFLAGATHHGNSTSISPEDAAVLWEYSTHGSVYSPPTVDNGIVYFGDAQGWIYAIDIDTKEQIWKHHTTKYAINGGGVWTAMNIHDGKLIFGCNNYFVYAIDADDGSKIWEFQTTGEVLGSPTISSGMVFATSMKSLPKANGTLYALDVDNGDLVWHFNVSESIRGSPAVGYDKVYFGCNNNKFYAVNVSDGEEQWNFTTGGPIESSPSLDSGTVFFGSLDKKFYALNAETGASVWDSSNKLKGGIKSTPAISYNDVFITTIDWDGSPATDNDGGLYVFNKFTGSLKWSKKLLGRSYASPAVAEGRVFVHAYEYIHAFDIASQSLAWEKQIQGANLISSPAIAKGRVFTGNGGSPGSMIVFGAPDFVIDTNDVIISDTEPFVGEFINFTAKVKNIGSVNGSANVTFSYASADKSIHEEITREHVSLPARTETTLYLDWQLPENPTVGENLWVMWFNVTDVEPSEGNTDNLLSKSLSYHLRDLSNWQMFQGNFEHTGYAPGGSPSNRDIWKNSTLTPGAIRGSVILAKDKIYVATSNGRVQSFYESSGQPADDFAAGGTFIREPTIFLGEDTSIFDRIYVASKEGTVYSMDLYTGSKEWSYDTSATILSTPMVYYGMVYVGASDGYLYALDEDGTAGTTDYIWRTNLGGAVGYSTPAISNVTDSLYIGTLTGDLVALNPKTGAINWTYRTGGQIHSTPTIVNDMVIVGSNDTKLYAFDLQGFYDGDDGVTDSDTSLTKGDLLWSAQLDSSPGRCSPAADPDGSFVYIGTGGGKFHSVSLFTGELNWTFDAGSRIESSAAVGDSAVFFTTESGKLFALDKLIDTTTDKARHLWNYTSYTKSSMLGSPAIYGNRVFCADEAGWVYALGAPNIAPVAVISSPLNGSVYDYTDEIKFDASASYDLDDTKLTFTWYRKGVDETTKTIIYSGPEPIVYQKVSLGNVYVIYLTVRDNLGANSTAIVNISIFGKPGDPDTPDIFEYEIKEFRDDTIPARCLIMVGGPGIVTMISASNPGENYYTNFSVNKFVTYRFKDEPVNPFKINWTNITIGFNKVDVMHEMNISRMRMYYWDAGWVQLPHSGVTFVDAEKVEVWANFTGLIRTIPLIFAPGTFNNTPPNLYEPWEGEMISPKTGREIDDYTFWIKYRDSDYDPPSDGGYVKVYIDGNPYFMTEKDPTAANYETYVDFTFTISGSELGSGSHTVSFVAHDGTIRMLQTLQTSTVVNITASKPVAEAGEDLEVKVDEVFTVDASGSTDPDNDIQNYYWDFDSLIDSDGDGNYTNDRDRSEIEARWQYTKAGTYTVTLTVVDATGSSDTDTLTVTVIEDTEDEGTELGGLLGTLGLIILLIIIIIIIIFVVIWYRGKEERELKRLYGDEEEEEEEGEEEEELETDEELEGAEEKEALEGEEEAEELPAPEGEEAEELEEGLIPEDKRLMPAKGKIKDEEDELGEDERICPDCENVTLKSDSVCPSCGYEFYAEEFDSEDEEFDDFDLEE